MKCIYIKVFQRILNNKNHKGFTLIELLVVVIIIGILSGMGIPILFKQIEKARTSEARTLLGTLNRTQQSYYFENGSFANNMTELGSDLIIPAGIYNYSVSGPVTTTETHHQAIPQGIYAVDTKSLASAVYKTGNNFTSVVCIGDTVGVVPTITSDTSCSNGTIIN